ncbi:MAG: hypothetical protein V7751_04865 [Pseudoalteromonas distincta]
MVTSLIDAIGREKASVLMGRAVLQAIDENRELSAEKTVPLVAVKRSSDRSDSLKKSVPIA